MKIAYPDGLQREDLVRGVAVQQLSGDPNMGFVQ
ncbi:hypothetical protein EV286_10911 [Rhizobium sp. BK251]|nr:hypothetical protein EV286_10911 [Rhizobium sp. BK251]